MLFVFIHFLFDCIAIIASVLISIWFRHHYHLTKPPGIQHTSQQHYYLLSLMLGLMLGSFLFGTANVYLSGKTGIAKSMLGGIAGAIFAAEIFKKANGIQQSTGLYFIPGLAMLIAIGRIGCFLAGLEDFTYGIPSNLPWAVDFGDGIQRHPVQLYETLTVSLFLIVFFGSYEKHTVFWQNQGFYLFIFIYASQRFLWEFLKPYASLGSSHLNLFQWLCLALMLYAGWMLHNTFTRTHHHATHQ